MEVLKKFEQDGIKSNLDQIHFGRGGCWKDIRWASFLFESYNFWTKAQQDCIQKTWVQFGQDKVWKKVQLDGIKSNLDPIGPHNFWKEAQQDCTQKIQVQVGQNKFWKEVQQDGIKSDLG